MNDYDKNVILRYLDSPSRIAFWTIDEIGVLFLPAAFGFIFEFPIIGIAISVVGYLTLKYIKHNIGGGVIRHAIYWYFPSMERNLKKKVKSHIREYIG